jgi:hypothetical protein
LQEILPSPERTEPVATLTEHWNPVPRDDHEQPTAPNDHWKAVWAEMSLTPARIGEPGLAVALVNGIDLVLACEHYMCDGTSLMQFSHELLQAIADPTMAWEPRLRVPGMTAMMRRTIPSRARRMKALTGYVKDIFADASYNKQSILPKSAKADRSTYDQECFMTSLSFSPNDAALLAKYAKQELNATVNAVAMVASMRALAECMNSSKSSKVSLVVAADGRRRYKESKKSNSKTTNVQVETTDLSAHATAVTMRGVFGGGKVANTSDALWARVPAVHTKLQKYLNHSGSVFAGMLSAPRFFSYLPLDDQGPTGVLSNWGRTPFKTDYGGNVGALDAATPLMNLTVFPSPYIVFSSTNGGLDVNIFGTPRRFCQADVDRIGAELEVTLKGMIGVACA